MAFTWDILLHSADLEFVHVMRFGSWGVGRCNVLYIQPKASPVLTRLASPLALLGYSKIILQVMVLFTPTWETGEKGMTLSCSLG